MTTADNSSPLVRLTYVVPSAMRGRVFSILKPSAAEPIVPVPAAEPIAALPTAEPATAAALVAQAVPVAPAAPAPSTAVPGAVVNVGLDMGRSETRIYDGEHLCAFPTLVGGPVATIRRGSAQSLEENLENNLYLQLGGHGYSIGRYAMEQPFLFPVNEENVFQGELNQALLLAALGLLTRRRGVSGETPRYKICLGLPVYLSRRPDVVDAALAQWVGVHEFSFCGEPMRFEIVQIDAIPQPVGAVYSALITGQLDFDPEETIGVIDPGHLTTDWVVMRLPNELTQFSGHTTAVAGCRLQEAISHYLSEQMVSRVNPLALQEALLTGVYQDTQGDTVAIPEGMIEDLKALMAQQIALTVKQSWRDVRIHRMLLVGAFGRVLYPLLTQYPYFRELQLAEDPRFTNVKGFFEYAMATPLRERS